MWLGLRRRWHARKIEKTLLGKYLQAPLLSHRQDWKDVTWLGVDIETTDLDPAKGEIVSIGWVPMRGGKILLGEARQLFVTIRKEVGQSAVFHQISDDDLRHGMKASEMLAEFLQAARGSVLVFHNAQLDMAFLNKLSRRIYGAPMLSQIADTLIWEKNKIFSHYQHIPPDTLRLHNCRRRYNLPIYPAHSALTDALATIELLMAQIYNMGNQVNVGDVLRKSAPF